MLLLQLSSMLLCLAAASAENPPPAPSENRIDPVRLIACLIPVLGTGLLANLMFALTYGGNVRLRTGKSTKRLGIDDSSRTEPSTPPAATKAGAAPSGLPPVPQQQMDSERSSR